MEHVINCIGLTYLVILLARPQDLIRHTADGCLSDLFHPLQFIFGQKPLDLGGDNGLVLGRRDAVSRQRLLSQQVELDVDARDTVGWMALRTCISQLCSCAGRHGASLAAGLGDVDKTMPAKKFSDFALAHRSAVLGSSESMTFNLNEASDCSWWADSLFKCTQAFVRESVSLRRKKLVVFAPDACLGQRLC